jgi:hypothetical protein
MDGQGNFTAGDKTRTWTSRAPKAVARIATGRRTAISVETDEETQSGMLPDCNSFCYSINISEKN